MSEPLSNTPPSANADSDSRDVSTFIMAFRMRKYVAGGRPHRRLSVCGPTELCSYGWCCMLGRVQSILRVSCAGRHAATSRHVFYESLFLSCAQAPASPPVRRLAFLLGEIAFSLLHAATVSFSFLSSFFDLDVGSPGKAGDNTDLKHNWLMAAIKEDPDTWLGKNGVILGDSGVRATPMDSS